MVSAAKTCELVFAIIVITVAVTLALYEVIIWAMVIQYTRTDMPPTQGAPFPKLIFCSRAFKNDSQSAINAPSYPTGNQATYAMSLGVPTGNYELRQLNSQPSSLAYITDQDKNSITNWAGGPLMAYMSMGFWCEGFLQECKVGGLVFSCCSRSTQISNFYGVCSSVDTGQYQTQKGLKGGMEIKLQLDAINNGKVPGGFYLFTDDTNFFPGDPIFIPMNKEIFITLQLGKVTKSFKPYGEFLCSQPTARQFVSYGSAFGSGYQSNYYGNGYSQQPDPQSYDECHRRCLSQYFFDNCQCWPVAMMSRSTAAYTGGTVNSYCLMNDSVNCIEPLLNGTQVVNWPRYTQKSTTNPILYCDRTCPPPCFELHASAKSIVIADPYTNMLAYPYVQSQASLIHLYFSSLDYGGTNEQYQWLVYQEVRELGLSICIWFTLASILILSVRAVFCCKEGSWKENFANVPMPNMGRIWPTGNNNNNRNGAAPMPTVQQQPQMIQADPEKVPIQAVGPTQLPPLERQG